MVATECGSSSMYGSNEKKSSTVMTIKGIYNNLVVSIFFHFPFAALKCHVAFLVFEKNFSA